MQVLCASETDCDSMAYKEDLQRVHVKIDSVIHRLDNIPQKTPPNQWQIASAVFAGCALIVTVLIAVYTHQSLDVKSAVKIEVGDQLKDPLKQSGVMAGDIAEIKGKLEILDPLIRDMISKRLRASENLSPKQLKTIVQAAKRENVALDPKDVQSAGGKLVDAGLKDPDAWDAALTFLGYKSFLNLVTNSSLNHIVGAQPLLTQYSLEHMNGYPRPVVSISGAVPKEQAAILEHIGENTNVGPLGNQLVFVDGSAVPLDGMHFKNVVFRNVHIVYHGGPVILENTYFLNCTFDIKPEPNGQNFASNFLKSPSLNFTAA